VRVNVLQDHLLLLQHSTSAFLQANLDGTTTAELMGLTAGEEPSLVDRLVRIVNFRGSAGLTPSVSDLTQALVESLVQAGLVPPDQASELTQNVLAQVLRPTTLTYTGATSADFNDPATLSEALTDSMSGAPIAGAAIMFTLGSQGCPATTDSRAGPLPRHCSQCRPPGRTRRPPHPAGRLQVV
jgi:hypothetical protein